MVETIGSFLLFVLLVLSILSLINIVAVQARIHYALTQAAQTISMYSYTLDVIGVADAVANNAAQAERVEQESDEFKQNLSQLLDGFESLDIAEIGSSCWTGLRAWTRWRSAPAARRWRTRLAAGLPMRRQTRNPQSRRFSIMRFGKAEMPCSGIW